MFGGPKRDEESQTEAAIKNNKNYKKGQMFSFSSFGTAEKRSGREMGIFRTGFRTFLINPGKLGVVCKSYKTQAARKEYLWDNGDFITESISWSIYLIHICISIINISIKFQNLKLRCTFFWTVFFFFLVIHFTDT